VEATAKFVKEMDEVKHFGEVFLRISPTDVERELSFIRKYRKERCLPKGFVN